MRSVASRSVALGWSRLLAAHVGNEEDDAEHDAECAHDDVADGEEVVCTAKKVRGGEDKVLAASEGADIVIVLDR